MRKRFPKTDKRNQTQSHSYSEKSPKLSIIITVRESRETLWEEIQSLPATYLVQLGETPGKREEGLQEPEKLRTLWEHSL